MTSPGDAGDEVMQAVSALMPDLRRHARTTLALMAFAVATGAAVAVMILQSGMAEEDRWEWAFYAGITGLVLAVVLFKWTRSTQEELLMPVLARSIGFAYGKNARSFVDALPRRLLPEGSVRSGEDHLKGSLGAHAIQMAEVTAETGGKDSDILFKGIVVQFANRTDMPAFFIARTEETRPGFFLGSTLSTEGLHHLRDVRIGMRDYGIWTSSAEGPEPRALSAVIDVLCGLEVRVGPGVELYAATSNGVEMHVALSHKRNLFRAGGLFPNKDRILADVQRALQDLKIPLRLAQALIQAEEAAVSKR
jgi:hypothetical protein